MILIDTGPLVALCDPRDSKHHAAVKDLEALATSALSTCEAVVTEACFHLPHASQRRRLRALLDELGVEPIAIPDSAAFWADVFEWLTKYAEHEPDWADGCLAVLSGRDKALAIWSYDTEFRTVWRRPDGTAIPVVARKPAAKPGSS